MGNPDIHLLKENCADLVAECQLMINLHEHYDVDDNVVMMLKMMLIMMMMMLMTMMMRMTMRMMLKANFQIQLPDTSWSISMGQQPGGDPAKAKVAI